MNDALQEPLQLTDYHTATSLVDTVIRAIAGDAWLNPTPCSEWTVRDLVGHLIDGQNLMRRLAEGDTWQVSTQPGQLAGDDPVAAWQSASRATSRRLDASALTRTAQTPAGTVYLGDFLEQRVSMELLIHAWDLARGASIAVTVDPDLVARVAARITPQDETLRGPRRFGPKQTTHSDDRLDQLAAFLGRQVDQPLR